MARRRGDTIPFAETTRDCPRGPEIARDQAWRSHTIPYADVLRGKGELVVGSAVAVRSDHVLVGTTAGVASRVLPFDYLLLSTGTSYQCDIKTDGTSAEHRKRAFEAEWRAIH